MLEAILELSGFNTLWLWVGSTVVLTILLFTWLRKGSDLVPELSTKAVVITGCDTGFGHDLAKCLDKLGLTVFAGCLFPEGDGAHELKSACSKRLHILHLDITREDHVQNAVKYVRNSLENKKLWAVVNNAGIAVSGPMEWMNTEMIKKVFEVNAMGPVTVTNAFLPLLKISRGRVVIVSSIAGEIPLPFTGVYCMTKHAVTALAKVLRLELKRWDITVHDIKPGGFRTNIANPEINLKNLESTWVKLPEEIRASYGQKYFENCKKLLRFMLDGVLISNKTYQVVESLKDAVVGKCPKDVYRPGLSSKVFLIFKYIQPLHQLIIWYLLRNLKPEIVDVNTKRTEDVTADKTRRNYD